MLFSLLVEVLLIILLIVVALFFWQQRKFRIELENRYKTLLSFHRIYRLILENLDYQSMIQRIADIIPNELRFATGVLAIHDEKKGVLKRIAASRTTQAEEAIKFINTLNIPFEKIEISINDPNNIMAKAVREKKLFTSTDVYDVLGPVLSKEEASQVQKIMGTKTTFAYPILINNYPIGIFLASTKKRQSELSSYELEVMNTFVSLIGLALQDSQLYTSLKNTKKWLEIANNKLQELDKLKDDFVSVASHELRTPMTAIRSYSWMALHRSDIKLSEKLKRYLYRTLISTERLINLVNDLLNISRIEGGKIEVAPVSFSMLALVKDVVEDIKAKADEKQIKIFVLEHANIPQVFADSDKIREVLMNLLGNSLKFTYPNGTITIDFFSDGKVLETSVKDTGAGIDKQDLGRLFQKFGRLDNSYVSMSTSGGTGLGLYISKSLVELMHGRIWANSDGIDQGSTFTFSLPLSNSDLIRNTERFHIKPRDGEAKQLEPVAL